MSTTKQCTRCGEVKALDSYYADKRRKDGRYSSCKECVRSYNEENKERIADYQRKYHQENKEKIAERKRKYNQENVKRVTEYKRKYRQENPEVWRRAHNKRRAHKRNLPHAPLTAEQYEILHRQKYEIFGGIANEH